MKILLIGDYPPPYGGIATHVLQLHQHFRQNGWEIRVLDIGKGGRPDPDVLPVRTWSSYLRRASSLAAAGHGIHLHTTGDNAKSWMVVASSVAIASLRGRPAVVTLHSGLLPEYLRKSRRRRLFAKASLSRAGKVIAVSSAVAESLAECGVPRERIVECPAFLSSQLLARQAPSGLDEVLKRRAPLIAYAHHPSPVYGRALMLAALKKISQRYPDVGLAVFGPGTRLSQFQENARAERVEGLIEDFGELPHPQSLGLLARCQLFVRPTLADGDSISVREALVLGVRCVASDAAQRPLGAMVFQSGNVDDFVERVCEALAGPPPESGPTEDAGPVVEAIYSQLWRTKGMGEKRAAVQVR
jgi:glycosyltransferase involved in cell wall biosynthesis